MLQNKTLISVVIPTFNRKDYLQALLIQLYNQNLKDCSLEIVIVVDGSTDGTCEMLEKDFPKVHVIKGNGNWWYTKSMNEGFKYCSRFNPDYILTLNDDIEIKKDYVQKLLESASKVQPNSVIGSVSLTISRPYKIMFSGVKRIEWWRYKSFKYHQISHQVEDLDELRGVHPSVVLPGRGMLIPYSVLVEMNYFDEIFIQYASDDDFCLRAANKGYKVFVSWDVKVFCHENLTGKGRPFLNESVTEFTKQFFNPYSPLYIKKHIIVLKRNAPKLLLPVLIIIGILRLYKAYLFTRVSNHMNKKET